MAAAYLEPRELVQGATYVEALNFADANGDPLDLEDFEALFQIRAGTADSGALALVNLTESSGLVLTGGSVLLSLTRSQTTAIVSSTSAETLHAELDLTDPDSGAVTTLQWVLKVIREYARAEGS